MKPKQISRRTFLSWSTTLAVGMALSGCGSTSTSPATATPMPTTTDTNSNVVKLVTGEFAPYSSETLPEGGAVTEIVKLVFAKMGREVQIDFKTWEQAYEGTLTSTYFGTFPWNTNEERQQLFLFSKSLMPTAAPVFTKVDSTFEFTNLESLTGLTTCNPKGWDTFGVDKLVEAGKVKMELSDDMEACLQMLKAGRVDIIVRDELPTWYIIKNLFGTTNDFKASVKPFKKTENYLMVSKTYPDGEKLLAEFNQALDELKKEGKIEVIIKKYTK